MIFDLFHLLVFAYVVSKSPIDLFSNSNTILDFAFGKINGFVSLDRPQCIRTQDGVAIVKRSISQTNI